MTNITIYSDTFEKLEKLSEEKDIAIADIIDTLVFDYLDEVYGDN